MKALQKVQGLVWLLDVFGMVGFGLYLLNWFWNSPEMREVGFMTMMFLMTLAIGIIALLTFISNQKEESETRSRNRNNQS